MREKHESRLTQRELDVLRLAAQRLTNYQIARKLHISPRTVVNHMTSIREKTGTHSKLEAVRKVFSLPDDTLCATCPKSVKWQIALDEFQRTIDTLNG